jgi:glutamate dehydrogenase (NAD(P)+)
MAPDVSLEECMRLARAMTLKNSAAGLAHGGGKSVLWGDPRMARENRLRTSIRSIELPAYFTWRARARRNRER